MGSLKQKPLRVLISGAGVAGPSLAFWLTRLGHPCTVVERCGKLRASGQQIDIREQGIEAVQRMGLLDDFRKIAVDEPGFQLVDKRGKAYAVFDRVESKPGQIQKRQTFSSEFEIMRPDLCRLLYEKTRHTTEYMFGKYVTGFDNGADGVNVTFSDGNKATYDVLVAADGQGSRVRRMLLKDEDPSVDYSRHMGVYCSYFTIPRRPGDTNMATVHMATGKRVLFTRFHSETHGQGHFLTTAHADQIDEVVRQDVAAQKALFTDLFHDAGWQAKRLIEDMRESDDFYLQPLTQVRSKIWSKGRVVLLGDAGYAPTPLTGMGTSLALIGAHILAGEMAKRPDDPAGAFAAYEAVFRPFVEETQQVPWGVPGVAFHKKAWEIKIVQYLLWLSTKLRLDKLMQMSTFKQEGWKIPAYPELRP
ncbi:hypothetical protein E4U42_002703 [Claviceps africana]|uniref:FAD-binding domain-containing protein n=1 Tax=Claviceps africana TaxID=83212 RepID=A0A8K0NJJ7_9HYPO|nr:hypothetical protein E4U42_002703 [Claviceps africana]